MITAVAIAIPAATPAIIAITGNMAVPNVVMAIPIATNIGDKIAATARIPPNTIINCLIGAERFLNHSANCFSTGINASMIGATASAIAAPISERVI